MPSDASRLNAALARDRINLDLKTLRVGWDNQSSKNECPPPQQGRAQPLCSEGVPHVFGMKCHPCDRNAPGVFGCEIVRIVSLSY